MEQVGDTTSVQPNETFVIPSEIESVRVYVKWQAKQQGIVCDLDLLVFLYDERARFFEKVDNVNKVSKDDSVFLRREQQDYGHIECLMLDFSIVKPTTSAVVLFLDGGPRNFQYLQSVSLECHRVLEERSYSDFLPGDDSGDNKKGPLFEVTTRTRKNYMGLVMCAFYKDGWNRDTETAIWTMRAFMDPVFTPSLKEKQDRSTQLIVNSVPALEKFRPRLFASIRDICAALSSHSLPKLKKKFLKTDDGLTVAPFIDTLFKQLYETYPKILEESEAIYAVAMLQEMFFQIDYNGDGTCNWDEFTTFCVSTGLNVTVNKKAIGSGKDTMSQALDSYVIEYGEEFLQRDHILSAYRMVSVMRYIPETRKVFIVSEDSDNILMLDEKFRMHAQLYPSKVQIPGPGAASAITAANVVNVTNGNSGGNGTGGGGSGQGDTATDAMKNMKGNNNFPRVMIYDFCFLSGRELIAYTASDHSITICREMSTMGANKTYFVLHNRFFHTLLHLKLCWSAKHDLLCTTASDRVIYGWNIDTAQIIFQVSRHTDIITDFIAADHMDVFITCSMDKRIVLWSATSRRVKGILLGHKRGVRCLSIYENLLLSAGFECDARLWDLLNKDCLAILRGHRHPIAAAKLMCERAQTEKEYRAITVDESGEFRLWNIYVKEKTTEPVCVPTLQIFEMQNVEYPINQFRFLAMPYNSKSSTSYYSNLIACSTKLLHFVPEKNTKEFVPPTACVCNEASAALVTAIGRSLITYDMSTGQFASMFEHVAASEIFSICMDGERGRRMFLGTSKGEILLINSSTGQLIDSLHYHTKEITSICQRKDQRNCVFSCAADGHIRMYEENGGRLTLNSSTDNVFGEGVGLGSIRIVPTLHVIIAASVQRTWGIMNDATFKKFMIFHEDDLITAMEIVGASRDKEHEETVAKAMHSSNAHLHDYEMHGHQSAMAKENLVTVALGLTRGVVIYTIDTLELRGVKTYELQHDWSIFITNIIVLRNPDMSAVNYSSVRAKMSTGEGAQIIAVTDEGKIVVWDVDNLRLSSEAQYRKYWEAHKERAKQQALQQQQVRRNKRGSAGARASAAADSPTADGGVHPWQAAAATAIAIASGQGDGSPTTSTTAPTGQKNATSSSFLTSVQDVAYARAITTPGDAINREQRAVQALQQSSPPRTVSSMQRTWVEGPASELLPVAATLLGHFQLNNSNTATNTSPTPHHAHQPPRRTSNAHPLRLSGSTNNTVPSSRAHSLTPGSLSYIVRSTQFFHGHLDAIPQAVALPTNNCFVSVSHDGFHRVWNLDGEILGELPLPNITEAMKQTAMCQEPGTQWKFILERIPVTAQHVETAHTIVRSIKATKQEKMLEYQLKQQQAAAAAAGQAVPAAVDGHAGRRRDNLNSYGSNVAMMKSVAAGASQHEFEAQFLEQQKLLHREDQAEYEARSRSRLNMLHALAEPPVVINEDRPPMRLPTKEEKELIKLTFLAQLETAKEQRAHEKQRQLEEAQRQHEENMQLFNQNFSPFQSQTTAVSISMDPSSNHLPEEPSMLSMSASMSALSPIKPNRGRTQQSSQKPLSKQQQQRHNGSISTTSLRSSEHQSSNNGSSSSKKGTKGGRQTGTGTGSMSPPRATPHRRAPLGAPSSISGGQSTSSPPPQPGGLVFGAQSTVSNLSTPHRPRTTSPDLRAAAAKSLRTSLLFNSTSGESAGDVCMASFGLPSLWLVPGEKDIFGNTVNMTSSSTTSNNGTDKDPPLPSQVIPPPFSEASIVSLQRENLIDNEGRRILREVAAKIDRVQVYERSQPTLLIRNAALSTSVTLPPLEQVKKTEIFFGAQKDMYKNAERVLEEKHDMNKATIRGAVAQARIDQNIRRVTSMIHLIQPPAHDEVILPKNSGKDTPGGGARGGAAGGDLSVDADISSTNPLFAGAMGSEEAMMKLRLVRSDKLVTAEARQRFQRPLDPASISRWTKKMDDALDITADSLVAKAQDNARKRQRKKKETISAAMVAMLEKKLTAAIKGKYFSRVAKARKANVLSQMAKSRITIETEDGDNNNNNSNSANNITDSRNNSFRSAQTNTGSTPPGPMSPTGEMAKTASAMSFDNDDESSLPPSAEETLFFAQHIKTGNDRKPVNLTTRELLPYYKLDSVLQFMDIFAKVDENFSGDLDVNEWIRLFTSLNESVPVQEARMIFLKIDKDGDGYLSMRELIPVVFGKATKVQLKKIIEFCEFELTKKIETETVPTVTMTDLEFLFEAYDSENVGFVDVAIVRDRVRKMALSDQQIFFFMEIVADLADDEMVNLQEFKRMFRIFTKTK